MGNSYFKFKKFTIYHDRCAMKVGTDGVLLGAWASANEPKRILDIGTGTGLIALQLAQRYPTSQITGIEIDSEAASQASENSSASPWASRIEIVCQDFLQYKSDKKFNLIVSNPPYFVDSLKCPDEQRNLARHAQGLSYELLFKHASQLLDIEGNFCVIIPAEVEMHVIECAAMHLLYPCQRLCMYNKPQAPLRRVLINFTHRLATCMNEHLYIRKEDNNYSDEYKKLTGNFYLNF